MSESNEQEELIQEVYAHAIDLKKKGYTDPQIRQNLIQKGLDKESAQAVVKNMNDAIAKNAPADDDSGGMGWLVWIAILIGVNVLSAIFDWPFWIY